MSPKLILGFLKAATTFLFWSLRLITIFVLVTSLLEILGISNSTSKFIRKTYYYEVLGFGLDKNKQEQLFSYSKDSLFGFKQIKDHYTLKIRPQSGMGYYALISQVVSLAFSISILWMFMKLFKQTKLENPFINITVKRLKTLAALFIVSDILSLINYFLFVLFSTNSFKEVRLRFELITTVGGGLITGLIIWVIAVIFQRGIELQEENALTV